MRTTGVAALALLLAGCGGAGQADTKSGESSAGPETFTAGGVLTLIDSGIFRAAGQCEGAEGYGDIRPGAVVIVRNATGDQVGLGELGSGRVEDSVTCMFSFEVPDIPDKGDRFTVEVSDRGQVPFSRDEAADIMLSLD